MISLFNMLPDEKKRPNSLGLMDMFEGVKDAILPILSNTPYGSATRKIKEHGRDFTRELGEGLYHDLPQGVIDLGTDIINRGGNLLGVEGDFIDRKSVQVVPPVFDEEERKKLGMKSLEEDSVGRILGQLLGGYAGIRGVLSKGLMSEAVAVSGAGSTLDPTKPNLSNFIQDTRFNNLLFEYMSAGVPEEAGAEERLLARVGNMTEELGLAFIPLGLIQGLRAMKNNPAIKEEILDTFHPDRMGGLLSDKTGLTTDYRAFAVPEKPKIDGLTGRVEETGIPSAQVDDAGFYLKSEQQILAMPQNQMPASQVEGFLKKRGVSPSEMKDLGLLDMLDGLPEGEMITKQGLLDYIEQNRITMTSDSLVLGGLDKQLKSLDAPDPVDYYVREKSFRGVNVDQLQRITDGEALPYETQGVEWETEKWYGADGTENKWKIMENEHHSMRYDELWEEINGELELTFDEHGAFQAEKTGDMFTSLQTFEELHKLYPDKYPETTVMRMDRLREAIKSREEYLRNNLHPHPQAESDIKAEILKAQNELYVLESNFKWGTEWDADILRGLKDGNLDNKILSDMDEAVDARTTKEYMDDPYFEIKVGNDKVGHYTFRGNDGVGWGVVDDKGDYVLRTRGHHYLNEAQVQLREYVQDHGFVDDVYMGEAKFTSTNWLQPNANMDTYSEELVRLETMPDAIRRGVPYEEGHYGDEYPNTIGHFRKTIRSGTVVQPDITIPKAKEGTYTGIKGTTTDYTAGELRSGRESGLFTEDDNVYFVEEIQSDWMQSGREFGFGEDAHQAMHAAKTLRQKEIGALSRTLGPYIDHMREYITSIGGEKGLSANYLGNVNRQMELHLLPEGKNPLTVTGYFEVGDYSKRFELQQEFLKTADNKILQKAFQLGDRTGHRMSHADVKELGFDPNEYSRTIQAHEVRPDKEWNDMWKVDPRNPESENFKGFGLADLDELQKWLQDEHLILEKWFNDAPYKQVPEFTPVKDQDRDVHLLVKRAIAKAIENGSTKVAFPNGDMILNVWNRHRDTTYHKKVRFEELYKNLYDKKIPKFLKKYAGQNKGKVGKMYIEDFQREVFYLEITPEMRESLLKEVDPPFQLMKDIDERGLIHPQSLYAKYPLPIGAGLLGMQEEKNHSGLLN